MPVVKQTLTSDFFQMPNSFAADLSLSPQEVCVLVYAMSKPADWQFTRDELCKAGRCSDQTLKRVLRTLREKGYLKVARIYNDGSWGTSSEYTFFQTPKESHTDEIHTDEIHTDESHTDENCTSFISNDILYYNINHKKGVCTRSVFIPPTVEEVKAYALEKGMTGAEAEAEAEKFVDYYAANGWKVGKNCMRDWKAAFRNWIRRQSDFNRTQPATATNSESDPFAGINFYAEED